LARVGLNFNGADGAPSEQLSTEDAAAGSGEQGKFA
jgi:hypothetical protein